MAYVDWAQQEFGIAAALAAIGFVGAAQWNSSLARQEFVTSAQRVLVTEAEQLQRQQEGLRAEIEEAEDRVRTFQERSEGSRSELETLNEALAAARLASGLDEVRARVRRPVSAFTRLDLPTLERPAKAISGSEIGISDSNEAAPATNSQGPAKSLRAASISAGERSLAL